MLTEEEKRELEHLENCDGKTDFQCFMDWWGDDIRIDFLQEKWLPLHSAIYWTELEKEFDDFCKKEFDLFWLDLELDD